MSSSSTFCTSTKSAICCNPRRPILKRERRDESTIIPPPLDSRSTRILAFMRCEETLVRPALKKFNGRVMANKYFNCCSVIIFVIFLATAQAAGRCFVNGPGASINGADYRRDYEISLKDCAITCREDQCCMAFEWISDGTCTLKSRSLNGTIVNVNGVHFGLCLDTEDSDRDRFWDHEVFGPETGSVAAIDRDECAEFCSTRPETQMYSWRTSNPRNMDESIGDCTCIKELNRMELNFGSFSGVLI